MKSLRVSVITLGLLLLAGRARSATLQETSSVRPATTLRNLRLEAHGDEITAVVEADGAPQHRVRFLEAEKQLVLDVLWVRNPLKPQKPFQTHRLLEGVRTFELPMPTEAQVGKPATASTMARLIFDLKKPADYRIHVDGRRLRVELTPKSEAAASTAAPPPAPTRPGYPAASIQPPDVDPGLFFDAAPASSDQYPVGPEDVLEIQVFELDQLNRTVRVGGDGNIDLPLIGAVSAGGLTADQVAKAVSDRLKNRYLQNPQVAVYIKEFNSRKVSLLGAVSRPATIPLSGRRNLLQILADAGGLGSNAGKQLYVFRQTRDGRSARLTVPLDDLLVKGDAQWNIWLHPGDVVSVPQEQTISVSVLGAVRSPGIHAIPAGDGATLAKAIARAGGLAERASQGGITIKRRDASGKESLIKADLGDILAGKKPDVILQEGDVILVKESFF